MGNEVTYGARTTRALRERALQRLAVVLVAGWFVAFALPSVAQAREMDPMDLDDTVDWMPAFTLSWGAHSQSQDGSTATSETNLAPDTGDSIISTLFQFEGKLHTPLQFDVPSHPRLFLSAGAQIPLAKELISERIDDEFNNGNPDFASACGTDPLVQTCSLEIRNRTTIDAMWFVGLGVDFTLPAWGTRFHISPAVEYFGMSVHTVGDFQRESAGTGLDDLVESANTVGDSEIYHGIAESITFSVEVYDDGPWRWSMFLQQRVGWLLNDPFTGASSTFGSNEITFETDLDDLFVQGTAGIQLQWTGR